MSAVFMFLYLLYMYYFSNVCEYNLLLGNKIIIITSDKEVMFSPGTVCPFVCLSVCDFAEIFRKCSKWDEEQVIRFWE